MCKVNLILRSFLLLMLLAFLITCTLVGHAASAAAPDAEALLRRSDSFRNGWPRSSRG